MVNLPWITIFSDWPNRLPNPKPSYSGLLALKKPISRKIVPIHYSTKLVEPHSPILFTARFATLTGRLLQGAGGATVQGSKRRQGVRIPGEFLSRVVSVPAILRVWNMTSHISISIHVYIYIYILLYYIISYYVK